MHKGNHEFSEQLRNLAPTRSYLLGRLKKTCTRTLVVALGLLGISPGAYPSLARESQLPKLDSIITNRKNRSEVSSLVLELASEDSNTNGVLAHRSHSSHRSHYSSRGGGSTTTTTKPKATTPSTSQGLIGEKSLSGTIEEVQVGQGKDGSDYFVLKDAGNKTYTIYYKDETKVRVVSPQDTTTTIGTLKAFTGSLPLKPGKRAQVTWKSVGERMLATLIVFSSM